MNNKPMLAENHVSKKQKNTYTIHTTNVLTTHNLFALCDYTPLPVMAKNGRPQDTTTGWLAAVKFPNPAACKMSDEYQLLVPYMGDQIARTIIEYLDKDTGKPVAIVFPSSVYVHDGYEKDFLSHMNHATRRDFQRQVNMRKNAMEQMRIAHQY